MKGILYWSIVIVLIFIVPRPTFAQNESSTEVSGYVMSDYYWVAKHHISDIKDKHGFWFRRIYLGFDHKFDDQFS